MRKTEECLKCGGCGERKPISEYYENKYTRCKECLKKYAREHNRELRGYKDASLFDINEAQEVEAKQDKRKKRFGRKGRFCTCCGLFKSWSNFQKDCTKSSGYKAQCKECMNKKAQERYILKKVKEVETTKPVKQKICSCCGKFKSIESFYKGKSYRDGHWNMCKECANATYFNNCRKKKEGKIKTFFKKLFRIK